MLHYYAVNSLWSIYLHVFHTDYRINYLPSLKKPCFEHLTKNTYLRHLFSFKHHKDGPFPVFNVVTNIGTQNSTRVCSPNLGCEEGRRDDIVLRHLSSIRVDLYCMCWKVSLNCHDVRSCCNELPILYLTAIRKIYYICTFVHPHRVTKRLRINLYRNSTVKLIITRYTQVRTFNDWPIDLNHSYI